MQGRGQWGGRRGWCESSLSWQNGNRPYSFGRSKIVSKNRNLSKYILTNIPKLKRPVHPGTERHIFRM